MTYNSQIILNYDQIEWLYEMLFNNFSGLKINDVIFLDFYFVIVCYF